MTPSSITFTSYYSAASSSTAPSLILLLQVLLILLILTYTHSLELSSMRRHYSHFQAKQNHPTTYEEKPEFKGPLILNEGMTTSDNRCRIKNYYVENEENSQNDQHNIEEEKENTTYDNQGQGQIHRRQTLVLPKEQIQPLKPTTCTDNMLKSIVDHLAYSDAPVDVKEVAESIEFFLRTRKRLMGAAKKFHSKCERERHRKGVDIDIDDGNTKEQFKNSLSIPKETKVIHVYDLCSGHGLTGILFAACNPPTKDRIVNTILVDKTEPPSFEILSGLIGQICPWLKDVIRFEAMSLEEFQAMKQNNHHDDDNYNGQEDDQEEEQNNDIAQLVIATHACGSLTDQVLEIAVDIGACGIAAMPCCYTGTDKGTPYGIKRALGVSWAADIRRCFYLNDNHYHSDLATVPQEITPMNRIIVAEDRS